MKIKKIMKKRIMRLTIKYPTKMNTEIDNITIENHKNMIINNKN